MNHDPVRSAEDPPAAATRVRRSAKAMAALRRELLAHARQIHRDEGPAALSMRRLAQAGGLSTMALYSYFPSKQALLEHLWLEVFEALLTTLLPVSAGQRTPLKVVEAHTRAFITFWEQRADQFRMIYMSAPQAADEQQVQIGQQLIYQQLVLLGRERVAACAPPGTEPAETLVAQASAHAVAKKLGFLLLTLGMGRYPLTERDALRERVVQDVVQGVAQALG